MRVIAISSLVTWLAAVLILWRYSDKIANRLAPTSGSDLERTQLDLPFDVGVGLAGLIFLVEGLKSLTGEAATWYFSKSDTFPYARRTGVIDVRHLAVAFAEAIIGLVLFVGAKSLTQGILKLRGMPPPTDEQDAA